MELGLSPQRLKELPIEELEVVLHERFLNLTDMLDGKSYGSMYRDAEGNQIKGGERFSLDTAIWEMQTALQVLRERIKSGEEVKRDAN